MEEVISFLDPRAYAIVKEKVESKPEVDNGVCTCGHSMRVHKEAGGYVGCAPGRMMCSCREPRVILHAKNLRLFKHMTMGHGLDHALARGVATSIEKLGLESIEWVDGEFPVCDLCAQVTGLPIAVSVGENGYLVETGGVRNKIVCQECFIKCNVPSS